MPSAMTAAFGSGFCSALMYLSVLTGSFGGMILVYLAPLPLFLAGLAYGTPAVLVAGITAVVLVVGLSGSLVLPLALLGFAVVPVVVVVRQGLLSRPVAGSGAEGSIPAVEWYPPGRLLVILTGIGGVALVAALVLTLGSDGGLQGVVQHLLAVTLNEVLLPSAGESGSGFEPAALLIAEIFPGAVITSWLLMVVINGLLAQGVLSHFGRMIRPALSMAELELPHWMPLVFALSVLGAVLVRDQVGYALVNLSLIQAVPFFFAGLGVVHAFARYRRAKVGILVMFYLILSVFAWPVLVVVGLGIIEQWARLRRRFAADGPDQGEA
ncbi:DUF2232 domain-containing protein [Azospirillaceae bacterium]